MDATVKAKIEKALDKVRPFLLADGGNVQLVDITNSTAKVKLMGGCSGCAFSQMTLKNTIERVIKEEVPEIKEVVAV
jgi:Fe-S cluster biogenesis protein NfuA